MDWKVLDLSHSFSLFLCLSTYLPIYFLCIYLSIYLSIDQSIYLSLSSNYLSIYVSIYLFIYLSLSLFLSSVYLSSCLSVYPSIYLSTVHLSIYLSSCLPVYLSIYPNLQKWREHVVFCAFWLRNVLRATTACTFSTSEPPKVARTGGALYILTWKYASRHNGVHFFDISTAKSGPDLVCFVHFDLETCFAPQRRALFQHPNLQKWREQVVLCTFWLGNMLRATTACTFSTSQLPKVVRTWCVLYILTWKRASHHNGVHFFDIATSKSGPELRCFVHFDLEICFAPQRRALFRHRNFQKWSEAEVFCTFWLANVLRATTACNFSSLIWPGGSAPAALASLLFDPPEPQIIGKTQCLATFLPFRASPSSFFLLFLFYSSFF